MMRAGTPSIDRIELLARLGKRIKGVRRFRSLPSVPSPQDLIQTGMGILLSIVALAGVAFSTFGLHAFFIAILVATIWRWKFG